jgi:hypothetical protein
MSAKNIACPNCGQVDRVEKVSSLFLSGIEAGRLHKLVEAAETQQSAESMSRLDLPASERRILSRKLAPPSSGKSQTVRPVHPDLVVLAFSGVLPVFLAGVATSQRELLVPILFFVVVFYGLYLFQRKGLIARFDRQKAARREEEQRIRRAIGRWMNLYYCAEDEGVFEPGRDNWTPVDQMLELLLR